MFRTIFGFGKRGHADQRRTPGRRRTGARRQPRLERLEDRTLLATRLTLNGPQTLVANANVNASNDLAGIHTEMTVDINPANPLDVAGFVHRIQDWNQIEVYLSTDGGASWTKTVITNSGPNNDGLGHGQRFDPSIKFNDHGWLFVAYGFIPDGGGSTRLMVGRTHDYVSFNFTFTSVDFRVGPDPALDKWHIATGRSDTNPNQDVLYVAYTRNGIRQRIAVAGSNNNGVGFTAPVDIDNIALPNGNLFAQPAVGPQGQLYVVWHNQGGGHVVLNRNLHFWAGGLWLGELTVATPSGNPFDYSVPAQPQRGVFVGPTIDVDRSGGPFNGRIYVSYMEVFNGDDTDVYEVFSTSQGAVWSPPNPVETASSTDFLPWLAVDQDTGSVNVAYYTTFGQVDNHFARVRLASSFDGGVSFPSKTFLASAPSYSDSAVSGYAGNYLEYIGLAVRDGTAQGFWADNRGPVKGFDSFSASASYQNSANVLTITGTNGNDTITLRNSAANSAFAEVVVNGNLQWAGLWASIGSVVIDGLAGTDVINIQAVAAGVTVNVKPSVANSETVNVGNAGNLSDIQGPLNVSNPPSHTTLNVDDSTDGATHANVVVTAGSITGLALATISYVQGDLFALNISTGTGPNTVNVQSTPNNLSSPHTALIGHSGATTVNVGNAGNLSGIQGALDVSNPPSYTTLNVDDSTDGAAHNNVVVTAGTITNLAPATISYVQGDLSALNISTGTGPNTVNVQSTPNNLSSPHTALIGHSGTTTVNVGNAGNLSGIQGALDVSNPLGFTTLNVDDSTDGAAHNNVVVTAGSITGLAPATISYVQGNLSALNISTGTGVNTVSVLSTPNNLALPHTALIGHSGTTTVNVGNAGNLSGIQGALDVSNPPNFTTLVVNDSADPVGQTATLSVAGTTGTISGLAPANINYATTDVGSLTVNGGSGGNTFNVEKVALLASGGTTVNAGVGGPGDCFHITPTSQSLANIASPLTLNGSGSGLDILDFFDQKNPANETYNFNAAPNNLTLTTVAVSINFNGFAGTSVYLETNGMSTVNDPGGMVNVDVPPPCRPDTGPGAGHFGLAQALLEAVQNWNPVQLSTAHISDVMVADLAHHAAGRAEDNLAALNLPALAG